MRDLFYIEKRAIQSAKFFELEKDSQRYENHTHAYANGARWMAGIKDAELEASRQECERLRERTVKAEKELDLTWYAISINKQGKVIKDEYTRALMKSKLTTKNEGGEK